MLTQQTETDLLFMYAYNILFYINKAFSKLLA
jgi:hypothetical protein